MNRARQQAAHDAPFQSGSSLASQTARLLTRAVHSRWLNCVNPIFLFWARFFLVGGLLACLTSACYVFADWHSLNHFYARFEELIRENASQRSLFIVATHQAAFRLNCFAEGVGVLLGAILAALGWAQLERAWQLRE